MLTRFLHRVSPNVMKQGVQINSSAVYIVEQSIESATNVSVQSAINVSVIIYPNIQSTHETMT